MKTFLALGALAAFCQSAFGFEEGRYRIESVSLPTNPTLSYLLPDIPLTFLPSVGIPTQTWAFEDAGAEGDFYIQNAIGGNLGCGTNEGSFCVGEGEQEVFTVELVGDNTYRLVSRASGYYLRVVGNRLKLATYDTPPEEQFVLSPLQSGSWGQSHTSRKLSLPYPLLTKTNGPDTLYDNCQNRGADRPDD